MPINTSFAGNIPWLITEPPSVALARGLQAGQGIAEQRLAQQRINLQAAEHDQQLQFQQAQQRALEGHRQVEEGLQQAQEARQKALFARTASNDLSRRIGMGMFSDALEIWHADHPDATPDQSAQAQTQLMLQHADKLFPDGQGFPQALQAATRAIGQVGVTQASIEAKKASAKASESLSTLRDTQNEALKTKNWLGPDNKSFAPTNLERTIEEAGKRGITFTQDELKDAFGVATGIVPRERVLAPMPKGNFISKHLESALKAEADKPSGPLDEGVGFGVGLGLFKKPTPKSRDQIIKDLGDVYDAIYPSKVRTSGTPAAPAAVPSNPTAAPTAKKLIFDPSTGSFKPAP